MEKMAYNAGFGFIIFGMMLSMSSAAVGGKCGGSTRSTCGTNEHCVGSACACSPGFTEAGNGGACTDVDDCKPNPCLNGATCVDAVNSYTCTCVTGWKGTQCERGIVGACTGGTSACPATINNSECSGQDCVCKEGYHKEKDNCVLDADECANTADNNCDTNAACTNTVGSFTCACNSGYTGHGVTCTDDDECANANGNNCGTNAVCTNTAGSFTCACNTGYTGDGQTCTAIVVACTGSPLACPATVDNSECFGKDCVCKEGYQKENDNCIFVPDNSAGKIAMAAVTMLMAVLTNIIIQIF